jgi:hypothetical protein
MNIAVNFLTPEKRRNIDTMTKEQRNINYMKHETTL